ncbi:MAG: ATP-binding protein, partial [Candidatus Micrarchaeota archaeon]
MPEYNFANAFENTSQIAIPNDPLEQVIGQENAVKLAKIVAKQRRNLLLVGPPGTGKSLIAQAIAFHLEKPNQEISVLHNPENPERPTIEIRTRQQIQDEHKIATQIQGKTITVEQVPFFVSEQLGFRCRHCGTLGKASQNTCANCGSEKYNRSKAQFGNLLGPYFKEQQQLDRVHTTKQSETGNEEVIAYQRNGEQIYILDQKTLEQLDALKKKKP